MSRSLREIVHETERFVAHGLSPFQALAATLEGDEWLTVWNALQLAAARKQEKA